MLASTERNFDEQCIPLNSEPQQGKDAVLLAARMALRSLDKSDEPIVLLNLSKASEKLDEWRHFLPRVTPHYAVKCNNDSQLLNQLLRSGSNFDCATLDEIKQVLTLGALPQNIVFSHPCKLRSHLQYAKAQGVSLMSFDSAHELTKIAMEFPGARLLLRLICEDSGAQCPMSSKFGATEHDWDPLLACAAELQLNIAGVSFHVGSGCKDPASFERALSDAKKVFELASARGFTMNVLDIGGGYPGVDSADFKFADFGVTISKQLDISFPVTSYPALKIIAEPGRFFAHSAASLLTKVFAKAQPSSKDEDTEKFRYYLNDGIYGSFNCLMYDHAEVTPELLAPSTSQPKPCCIFGPTCDGLDVLLEDYMIPELQVDDWILWRNMGAYTTCAASRFNGFPLPKTLYFNAETLAMSSAQPDAAAWSQITYRGSSLVCMKHALSATAELRSNTSVNLKHLQDKLKIDDSSTLSWKSVAKWSVLAFCSVMWALKTIGFSWAATRHTSQFCPFSPTIVQSAGLATFTLMALLCIYGRKEVQLLHERRYLWFAVSGFLEGLMFCLHNFALTKVSAVTVTVLMQGQFFMVMLLQTGLLHSYPIVTAASAVCLLLSYNIATWEASGIQGGVSEESIFASGILPAIGAALCSGACDFALEYFAKRSMKVATNQNADLMRCFVCHEVFKIPVACVMLILFDPDFAQHGIFHGWDYSVAFGGVGLSALALIFVNVSVVCYGARPTNLALSMEVAIVYLLEVFALQTDNFSFTWFLEVCCLAGMVAACNLDMLSMPAGERKADVDATEAICGTKAGPGNNF